MFFSIITVSYNSEKTIRRTFESVLNQSFTDYEYLVIDGQSKDRTLEIIREYEPEFAGRMRWISEPDKGIYDAMNKALRMVKGHLIGIINSDDYYHPDALRRIHEEAIAHPGKNVYHGILGKLNASGECFMLERSSPSQLLFRMIEHPASFLSRETYDSFGLFNGEKYSIAADYDLFLRIYQGGGTFQSVDHIIAYFSMEGISCRRFLKTVNEALSVRAANGIIPPSGILIRRLWNFYCAIETILFEKFKGSGIRN